MATLVVNKTTLKNYDKNFKGTKAKCNPKVKVYDSYGRQLNLEKGHYSSLTLSGSKLAHHYTCKCKMHIQNYILHIATTEEIEKGIEVENITYKTCIKCYWVDSTTQRNTDDRTVWDQSDGSIIVKY